jgi:hypothetical protein
MARHNLTKEYVIIVYGKDGKPADNFYRYGRQDADMKADEERRKNVWTDVTVSATGL